jgi:molecular chaperone GrpE
VTHKKASAHNKNDSKHSSPGHHPADHSDENSRIEHPEDVAAVAPEVPAQPVAEELLAQLKNKEQENKDLYDRLLRGMADFDNYKKRVSKDKDDLIRYGNEKLIRELLPVIDNFERAIGQADTAPDSSALKEGIEMILKQFLSVLEKFGVTDFSAVGQPFDPNKHEAMVQQESIEHEENTVMSEFQKGYYLHDRLLRPALVAVAKQPADSEAAETPPNATIH